MNHKKKSIEKVIDSIKNIDNAIKPNPSNLNSKNDYLDLGNYSDIIEVREKSESDYVTLKEKVDLINKSTKSNKNIDKTMQLVEKNEISDNLIKEVVKKEVNLIINEWVENN
jgi:hypothetical protein